MQPSCKVCIVLLAYFSLTIYVFMTHQINAICVREFMFLNLLTSTRSTTTFDVGNVTNTLLNHVRMLQCPDDFFCHDFESSHDFGLCCPILSKMVLFRILEDNSDGFDPLLKLLYLSILLSRGRG